MGRKPCCEKVGLKRGPWTAEEDGKLVSYITTNGICCWRALPKLAGLLRCGKSCRLRWTNYLRPDLKRGIFTEEEADLILNLHATLGNRWSRIAAQLPGRTDNEIKNYWNTRLKKRLFSQGFDPATHLPLDGEDGEDGDSCDASASRSVKKGAKRQKEVVKPVRQPRGPKPALPQLKMCRSNEGLLLVKVPKVVPKISPRRVLTSVDDDSDFSPCPSSCSTVTTKSLGSGEDHPKTLARAPSYPEAELWKCIKPSTQASLLSTAALLDEWDSCSHLTPSTTTTLPKSTSGESSTMQCCAKPPTTSSPHHVSSVPDSGGMTSDVNMSTFTSQPAAHQDFGTTFSGSDPCLDDQPEMWSLDVEMGHPEPESLFAANSISLNSVGFYSRELQEPAPHPSQDLQKLAALLDLI